MMPDVRAESVAMRVGESSTAEYSDLRPSIERPQLCCSQMVADRRQKRSMFQRFAHNGGRGTVAMLPPLACDLIPARDPAQSMTSHDAYPS
jgi:hypothetical protein